MAKFFGMETQLFTRKYCSKTDGHYHLKSTEGDCQFLKNKKCSVYSARPVQCRTWPFWPENMNAKSWNQEVARFCPGVGKGKIYSQQEIEKMLNEMSDSIVS